HGTNARADVQESDLRHAVPELATDREAHIKGTGCKFRWLRAEGGRAYLGRSAVHRGFVTEGVARCLTSQQRHINHARVVKARTVIASSSLRNSSWSCASQSASAELVRGG